MGKYGLMIDYEFCTGCHSCEVACRNVNNLPLDKWGIKICQVGPWKVDDKKWEWNYIPVPTELCDLCEDRTAKGRKPACVQHCQALCMEYGTIEELTKKMTDKGSKVTLFLP